jgi:hypothetical protein
VAPTPAIAGTGAVASLLNSDTSPLVVPAELPKLRGVHDRFRTKSVAHDTSRRFIFEVDSTMIAAYGLHEQARAQAGTDPTLPQAGDRCQAQGDAGSLHAWAEPT